MVSNMGDAVPADGFNQKILTKYVQKYVKMNIGNILETVINITYRSLISLVC